MSNVGSVMSFTVLKVLNVHTKYFSTHYIASNPGLPRLCVCAHPGKAWALRLHITQTVDIRLQSHLATHNLKDWEIVILSHVSLRYVNLLTEYFSPLPHAPPLPPQLSSIIVFGCISDKVDIQDLCLYNLSNACSFGVAVGVIGFVMCLVFLVKDVFNVVIDYSNNLIVSPPT